MRNRILIVILFITLVSVSCSKDDDDNSGAPDCTEFTERINESLDNYTADPSKSNCEAYVDAIRDFINGDCYGFASQNIRDTYDAALDALDGACN